MEETITLVTRRKAMQPALDYCLDQRISFTVKPVGLSPEDFHIELAINGIKQALALGMFVKEHKFELLGQSETAKQKTTSASKKTETKENIEVANASVKNEQQPVTTVLNF